MRNGERIGFHRQKTTFFAAVDHSGVILVFLPEGFTRHWGTSLAMSNACCLVAQLSPQFFGRHRWRRSVDVVVVKGLAPWVAQ